MGQRLRYLCRRAGGDLTWVIAGWRAGEGCVSRHPRCRIGSRSRRWGKVRRFDRAVSRRSAVVEKENTSGNEISA